MLLQEGKEAHLSRNRCGNGERKKCKAQGFYFGPEFGKLYKGVIEQYTEPEAKQNSPEIRGEEFWEVWAYRYEKYLTKSALGEPGLLPCLTHVHLTGCTHQGLGATFIHLLSVVIFSRVCVLAILDLPFDFSDWTKTSV